MLKLLSVRLGALLTLSALLAGCGGQTNRPTTPVAGAPDTPATALPATALPTLTRAAPTATLRPTSTPPSTPTASPVAQPGVPTYARGSIAQRPYVVMFDNHPDAYPQSGLDQAAVVFEALAEYGVTRFMGVYAPSRALDLAEIGPVRSARTYFVQWAMGFHGLYAHAGGSPEGLALAESATVLENLDGLRSDGEPYFARSSAREAPHNLYTSSADLARAARELGAVALDDPTQGFLFKPDAPERQRPADGMIEYFFIYDDQPAGWLYDRASNGYLRTRYGMPALDAITGDQLWTKNVVVMEVAEAPIPGDDAGRIELQVVGQGQARLFADGAERAITWRKDAPEAPLRFYAAEGEEVRLNVGPLWIAALPSLQNLTTE